MSVTRLAYLFTAALLLCPLTTLPCSSQTDDATISGRVTASSGAVVAGVAVQLQSAERGTVTDTTTNEVGIYVFPAVHPGVYYLTVRKPGFREVDVVGLTANVQAHVEQNLSLQVGAVSESVTVSGDTAKVNAESAAVSTVVDSQFVDNMPLNGRSFQSLIALVPGVVNTADQGQFSINGQRSTSNYFMVDGVSANLGSASTSTSMSQGMVGATPTWTASGSTNGMVSVDALQEFRIQTSTYAPEYGRTPGGQISLVTKSGVNQWHGTAFDYLRNDVFDARNWFNDAPQPQPPLRQNDFGGTFSGPIWRDHTFFFFSYEGLRLRLPQVSVGNFLTVAARSTVAAPWEPIVNAEPVPTGPVNPDGITAPLTTAYSIPSTLNSVSMRIDHTLNSHISLFGRYNHAPSSTESRYFAQTAQTYSNSDSLTVGMAALLSTTKVNDFRFNWSRNLAGLQQGMSNFYGAVPPPNSAIFPPGVGVDTAQVDWYVYGDSSGGVRVGNYDSHPQHQLNFVDDLSWTRGTHQMKFGIDWRRLTPSPSLPQQSYYGSAFGYPSLQAGTLDQVGASSGTGNRIRIDNYSLYAQDTWKAAKRLTLTYGLRWELNPAPSPTSGGKPIYNMSGIFDSNPIALFQPSGGIWSTDLHAFAPRFGVAYQLTAGTVLRGGFGLFYDLGAPTLLGLAVNDEFPYVNSSPYVFNLPFDFNNPAFPKPPAFTLTPSPSDPVFGVAFDPNMKLPVTYQWNVAVERALGRSQTLSVTYVGSKGQDLIRTDSISPPLAPQFFAVNTVRNADWSRYDSLQLQFRRSMSHGLQALASYTLATSKDTASNDGVAGVTYTSLSQTNPGINWGYSNFDVRNTFSAALSYQVPAPSWGGAGHALVSGWALDGIVQARSGTPLTILDQNPVVFNGRQQYLIVNVVPGQPFWISNPIAPGGRQLNPAAFADPVNGPGDLGRNTLRDFSASQLDLAVRRQFRLTERVKLDLRMEYFNLFNHPNFAIGNGSYATYWGDSNNPNPSFGVSANTLNQWIGGSSGTGALNELYAIGGPRSGQISLKLIF